MTSRLSSLLTQEGLVSAKKVAEAFQRQVIYGGTLDTILLEMDIIDEATLIDAMTRSSGLATAGDLPPAELLADASRWFAQSVCERFRAVPIARDGNILRVLVTDPTDRKQLDELGFMLSLSVDPLIVPEYRFQQAVERVYRVALPARFGSLVAKLKQRAASQPATVAKMAPKPLATPVVPTPIAVPKLPEAPPAEPRKVITDVPLPTVAATPAPTAAAATVPALTPAAPAAPMSPLPTGPTIKATPGAVAKAPPVHAPKLVQPPPENDEPAAPVEAHTEMPTPRATPPRASDAPRTKADSGRIERFPLEAEPESTPLSIEEAGQRIGEATDRDAIFTLLCRGARSQLPFVALLSVNNDVILGRLALGTAWVPAPTVAELSITPSGGWKAAIDGRAPFLGRLGDDPGSAAALTLLERKAPVAALLSPIVLRDRVVALLYGDAAGRPINGAAMAALSTLTAAAARAFQRLIVRQKGGEYSHVGGRGDAKLRDVVTPQKLHEKPTGPLATVSGSTSSPGNPGSWMPATASGDTGAKLGSSDGRPHSLHELPTQRFVDPGPLVGSVIAEDAAAPMAAQTLIALGSLGAAAVVAALPGPLKVARHALRGPLPPLADHGPLLQLLARFGEVAEPALLARLDDNNVNVRYYVALALGTIDSDTAITALGKRLYDVDAGVRHAALRLLDTPAKRQRPAFAAMLDELRGDLPGPDQLRQEHACDALGGLHDAASVPRLVELVKESDAGLVLAARAALTDITKQDFGTSRWRWRSWWDRHRQERRLEWLLEGLGHSDESVRQSAADELRPFSMAAGASDGDFGFRADQPRKEREESRRRWVEWWRSHANVFPG